MLDQTSFAFRVLNTAICSTWGYPNILLACMRVSDKEFLLDRWKIVNHCFDLHFSMSKAEHFFPYIFGLIYLFILWTTYSLGLFFIWIVLFLIRVCLFLEIKKISHLMPMCFKYTPSLSFIFLTLFMVSDLLVFPFQLLCPCTFSLWKYHTGNSVSKSEFLYWFLIYQVSLKN